MKKFGTFRKVKFSIERNFGKYHDCGQYIIKANYKNVDLVLSTNDSEIYDWIDDDENMKKHKDALKTCYNLIRNEYNKGM